MSDASQLFLPIPLELLELPEHLNGCNGRNRATEIHPQIAAQNDVDALRVWLARFADTKTTFDSYRKEAERLLLWAVVELGIPLSSLTHEDLLSYQRFLADPQPAERWVMKTGRKWARHQPEWRPFAGPLAATSQRQAILILNALFGWLVDAGYLAGNPLSLSRSRQRRSQPRMTRYLDEDLWRAVKSSIESMPRETDRECQHSARVRWLFSLLYLTGMRISEVAGNTMGGFFHRSDADDELRWWLEIVGKGNKVRILPATTELMIELTRFRRENGLTPYPLSGEATPLLLPIGNKRRAMTRSAIHLIVKQVFENAARCVEYDGRLESLEKAQRLRAASAHWLRHTAGSNMLGAAMDLRHVRDNLGHDSISTTSKYLHSEDDLRHKDTEEKHRLEW